MIMLQPRTCIEITNVNHLYELLYVYPYVMSCKYQALYCLDLDYSAVLDTVMHFAHHMHISTFSRPTLYNRGLQYLCMQLILFEILLLP
jgi:hypothetical protein